MHPPDVHALLAQCIVRDMGGVMYAHVRRLEGPESMAPVARQIGRIPAKC
jgi:hypothetical protein